MRAHRGTIIWEWTPEIWRWRPDAGRWSPRYGAPREPVYLKLSTVEASLDEAFDFWREAAWYGFDGERPRDGAFFEAEADVLLSDGVNFSRYRSAAVAGGRTLRQARRDGHDGVDVGLVLAGSRRHLLSCGEIVSSGPGEFFVYDAARPSQLRWSTHEGVHLTFGRRSVEAALGGAIPPAGLLVKMLAASGLAPVLRAQMRCLADNLAGLSASERAFALDQTARTALFALEGLPLGLRTPAPESQRARLFSAAERYIERHLTHYDLDAQSIANAVGASRPTLYRAFAERGLTVAGMVREMRLMRARRKLQEAPPHVPVSEIALRSGFIDMRTFHRAFRSRFGMSPGKTRDLKNP